MNKVDQIKVINDMINEARTNLKPLSFNLVFWGIFINIMSIIHYTFPSFIQQTNYSAGIYWIFLPMIGMIYMTRWNIKKYKEMGYSTTLGRVIKIVWAVFGLGWLMISGLAFYQGINPVADILFLLGLVSVLTGAIIKFKPIILGGIFLLIFVLSLYIYPGQNALIVNIIGITLGLLIPGILLNRMKTDE